MFGKKEEGSPAPKSGAEIMMRSMGMGPILDMAIGLANDGTLAKIVTFADQADEILKLLREIKNEMAVAKYEAGNRIADTGEFPAWTPGVEPCPRCRALSNPGGDECASCGLASGMPGAGSSAGHDNGSRSASGGAAVAAIDGNA